LILSNGAVIDLDQLPPELRNGQNGSGLLDESAALSLDKVQHETIAQALKDTNGNRTQAARLLGISRSTLKRKLAEMRKP
jgi:transcriptional regulator of acetoin/glycerol metabolism